MYESSTFYLDKIYPIIIDFVNFNYYFTSTTYFKVTQYIEHFKENQEQFKKLLNVGFLKRNIFFILISNFTKVLFLNYFNNHSLVIDEKKIIVIK